MFEGRMAIAIAAVAFSFLGLAICWLLALAVRLLANKRIGSPRYYQIAAVGGAALGMGLLNAGLLSTQPSNTATVSEVTIPYAQASGLDAPFIAPDESRVEAFPDQLEAATASLLKDDRSELNSAMEFLTFGTLANLSGNQVAKLESGDEKDTMALVLMRMYRFARSQGDAMTLRHFVHLSEEMKREKPEWWVQFQEIKALSRVNDVPPISVTE